VLNALKLDIARGRSLKLVTELYVPGEWQLGNVSVKQEEVNRHVHIWHLVAVMVALESIGAGSDAVATGAAHCATGRV
jgi:hypothetical protein